MKRIWRKVLIEHGDLLIVEASPEADYYEATDMVVMAVNPDLKLACRVRRNNIYRSFPGDFTIRNHGTVTELEKIVDKGYGNYYLYAFADKSDRDLVSWFVGDLDVFRREYKHAVRVKALGFEHEMRKIEWSEVVPPGRTPFLAFKVETFLPEFIIASYNHDRLPQRINIIDTK